MDKEKHRCSEIINYNTSRQIISKMISRDSDEICNCNAKYLENSKWYCGKHAPSKVREREEKRYNKWLTNKTTNK